MADNDAWYLYSQDEQIGPMSFEELNRRITELTDVNNTFVWTEGFSDWKNAADVPELWERTPDQPSVRTLWGLLRQRRLIAIPGAQVIHPPQRPPRGQPKFAGRIAFER
jgi:hypothetical protein